MIGGRVAFSMITTSSESDDSPPFSANLPTIGLNAVGSGTDALDEGPHATAPIVNPLCGISAEGDEPDDTLRLESVEFANENPVGDPAMAITKVNPRVRTQRVRSQGRCHRKAAATVREPINS